MAKRILEDIKPISRAPRRPAAAVEVPIHVVKSLPREVPFEPSAPRRSSRYALWYIAAACVVGFLFSLSFLFERAVVDITPKSLAVAFDTSDAFVAEKDSDIDGAVVYTQMTLSGDDSIKLPATITKTESQKATGTVIVYNAYSSAPYKLVVNTRLATPAGKIYRLDKAVTIPGAVGSGASMIPGSVSVTVTAAEAGTGYDITTSDFTVPGLAGTPQATKIYARTKTPITGGSSGTVHTISEDAASAARGTLEAKLRKTLVDKARAQVPDGYLLYEGATLFVPDETAHIPYSTTEEVPLALHGTLTAYIIKQDTLEKAIAISAISQYDNELVGVPDIAALRLVPSAAIDPAADTAFHFTFAGTATLVWGVDQAQVQTLLAGRKKKEFQTLIAAVKGVDRAQVTLKPFWKQAFPEDTGRITVTVEKPR